LKKLLEINNTLYYNFIVLLTESIGEKFELIATSITDINSVKNKNAKAVILLRFSVFILDFF
jgi:hypothetical protein